MESLRKVGLFALVIGAPGAVGLMFYTGRRNPSAILMVVFAIWVLSPFLGLGVADAMSSEWSALTRTALYALMIVITIDTLAMYAYIAFGPSRPQPAFTFLVVPPASWLLGAFVLRVAAVTARRRANADVAER